MDTQCPAPELIERALTLLGGIRLSDPEAAVMLPWVLAHSAELRLHEGGDPDSASQALMSRG
jgi:hypothetical protein